MSNTKAPKIAITISRVSTISLVYLVGGLPTLLLPVFGSLKNSFSLVICSKKKALAAVPKSFSSGRRGTLLRLPLLKLLGYVDYFGSFVAILISDDQRKLVKMNPCSSKGSGKGSFSRVLFPTT